MLYKKTGTTIRGVVYHPRQFECFEKATPSIEGSEFKSKKELCEWVSNIYLTTNDPTRGADHYHNPNVKGEWAKSAGWRANCDETEKIGRHVFYKQVN